MAARNQGKKSSRLSSMQVPELLGEHAICSANLEAKSNGISTSPTRPSHSGIRRSTRHAAKNATAILQAGADTDSDEEVFKNTPSKYGSKQQKQKENITPSSKLKFPSHVARTSQRRKENEILQAVNLDDSNVSTADETEPESLPPAEVTCEKESLKRKFDTSDSSTLSRNATTPTKRSVVQKVRRSLKFNESAETGSSEIATPACEPRTRRNLQPVNYKEMRNAWEIFSLSNSSDSDSEQEPDSHSSESGRDSDLNSHRTPVKLMKFNGTIPLTPTVSKILEDNGSKEFTPRRTPKLDQVRNTPNSESYFTADARVKFKTMDSVMKAEEARKKKELKSGAKKPRKGNRQGIDKQSSGRTVLPQMSVSKELAKMDTDVEVDNPWLALNRELVNKLITKIANEFPRWMLLLRRGFNIMLHGYGSKQCVFQSIIEYLEDRFPFVVINGLFPKLNARKFLLEFTELLEHCPPIPAGSSVFFIIEKILDSLEKSALSPIFLLVMNFDVLAVRHPQMLTVISGLARLSFVHLIASSDHINAGLGLSPKESSDLNFVWTDCTTFEPFVNELMWEADRFGYGTEGGNSISALDHVLKSLTQNARRAFSILIGMQLHKIRETKSSKAFQGIPFRMLLQRCRELYITHSELGLKSLLTEFIDHKFIRYAGKSKHDENNLIVTLEPDVIEKYAEM